VVWDICFVEEEAFSASGSVLRVRSLLLREDARVITVFLKGKNIVSALLEKAGQIFREVAVNTSAGCVLSLSSARSPGTGED